MDALIEDIEFAVVHHRWLLALTGTLALPDICAAVGSANGQTTGARYKAWVQEHLSHKYPRLDPDELYKMRCSLLHQGTSSTVKYSRIIFCGPDASFRIHNGVIQNGDDEVLLLDLPTFCSDVITAVRAWKVQSEGTQNYQQNIGKLMRWRAQGMEPYVIGASVLT